jgi:hypothetical protein
MCIRSRDDYQFISAKSVCPPLIICLLVFLVMACKPFREPERIKAIGSTAGLPATIQRAYNPGDDFSRGLLPESGKTSTLMKTHDFDRKSLTSDCHLAMVEV